MPPNYPNPSVAPWATVADVCEPCSSLSASIDQADLADCIQAASDILFELSGRRWAGLNTDTVRPYAQLSPIDGGRPIVAYHWAGSAVFGTVDVAAMRVWGWGRARNASRWRNGAGGWVDEIQLGVYPLVAVPQVLIDGVALVQGVDYNIAEDRYLARLADPTTGSPRSWPIYQRMDLPPTAPQTWQVTFTYGSPPPVAGKQAAAELGCQLALSRNPTTQSRCALPERVTHISRHGLSAVVLDPWTFLDKGLTGLQGPDRWLQSLRIGQQNRRATVRNVDIGPRVRRTSSG